MALATLGTAIPLAAQRAPVDTLRWLAGCWRLSTATRTVEEQWMAPAGGVMLGMSRTVVNGRYREHEFLRIYSAGDTLVYAPQPSGQAPAEFRSTRIGPGEIVFENPVHDFPTRIEYRRVSTDTVTATVGSDRPGARRPLVFAYVRSAC